LHGTGSTRYLGCMTWRRRTSLAFLVAVLATVPTVLSADDGAAVPAERRLRSAITRAGAAQSRARLVPGVAPFVDLTRNKPVLQRILAGKTDEALGLDDAGPAEPLAFTLVRSPRQVRVTSSFWRAPAAQGAVLVYVAKAWGALAEDLAVPGAPWALGLCGLVAQELTWPRELATCPVHTVEVAIAALLVGRDDGLVWTAFPPAGVAFDGAAYRAALARAVAAAGGDGAAVDELLAPAKDDGALDLLKRILPDTPEALRRTADDALKNIGHRTLALVIVTGCYEKLCAGLGRDLVGRDTAPSELVGLALAGDLDEQGPPLLHEVAERRRAVLEVVRADVKTRGGAGAADPFAAPWALRFLHDYGTTLPQGLQRMRAALEQKRGVVDPTAQDDALRKLLAPERLVRFWSKDPEMAALFALTGEPLVTVAGTSDQCPRSLVVQGRFRYHRSATDEDEDAPFLLVSPLSSGGGGSSGGGRLRPGVRVDMPVWVRRRPGAPAERMPAGEVARGMLVRTVEDLDDERRMTETWARVVSTAVTRKTPIFRIASSADPDGAWFRPLGGSGGDGTDLHVGVKQAVRVTDGSPPGWARPSALRPNRHKLFALDAPPQDGPGPTPKRAPVTTVAPVDGDGAIVEVTVAHRGVPALERQGKGTWAYYVADRLVGCPAEPGSRGLVPPSAVQVPDGTTRTLAALAAVEQAKVAAFAVDDGQTYVDELSKAERHGVDYLVTLSFRLPDGIRSELTVAEGQPMLFVRDGRLFERSVLAMQPGDRLVVRFDPVVTVPVDAIEGRDTTAEVVDVTLVDLPLIRAQGVLVPVQRCQCDMQPGIEIRQSVQPSPGLDAIRAAAATAGRAIDLHGQFAAPAGTVGEGALVLSYNGAVEPRGYHQSTVAAATDLDVTAHIVITTPCGTLTCGAKQEVFVGDRGLDDLSSLPAGSVRKGQHLVHLRRQAVTAVLEATPVTSVAVRYATTAVPRVTLREYVGGDPNLMRAGIEPTFFANDFLVLMTAAGGCGVAGQGQGQRGQGTGADAPGTSAVSPLQGTATSQAPSAGDADAPSPAVPGDQVPGSGPVVPRWVSLVRVGSTDRVTVLFDGDDEAAFRATWSALDGAWAALPDGAALAAAATARSAPVPIGRFLGLYFETPEPRRVYDGLAEHLAAYRTARDMLVTHGDTSLLPGVVNGYVFLSTLLYASGATAAGDALTADYCCVVLRTLAKPVGKRLYDDPAYAVRPGLAAARDIVGLVRQGAGGSGFDRVASAAAPAAHVATVMRDVFVAQRGLADDVCRDGRVNLYNLTRQLDRWSGTCSPLPTSRVAPAFDPGELFGDPNLAAELGVERLGAVGSGTQRRRTTDEPSPPAAAVPPAKPRQIP